MTFTVLSLFDGIGCGRLALDRLGMECVYYASEIDSRAQSVCKDRYPDVIHIGDVRTVRYIRHSKQLVCDGGVYDVGDIDLLIGGSPCQGFSKVGPKTGFEHSESTLIYEFERIRNECRPRYVLLENVYMNEHSREVVGDMLSGTPSVKRYDINSDKYICQNRRRLYWTNIPFDPDDVRVHHPLHLRELIGDGYEGVRMKQHGFTSKDGVAEHKFIKDRKVAQTITKCRYLGNSALVVRGVVTHYTIEQLEQLQTLPVGYTSAAGAKTHRVRCVGNCWTVAVIEHIMSGLILNGNIIKTPV